MANVTLTLKIKGTALTMGAMGPVIDWYNNNSGTFPGKVELKRNGKFVQAVIDGNPIGNILDMDNKNYSCPECSFDDKGNCLDDYEFMITGGDLSSSNQLLASLTLHTIDTVEETEYDATMFEDDIKRIVEDGCCTEERVRDNIARMQKNNLPPAKIKMALDWYIPWKDKQPHYIHTTYLPANLTDKFMEHALTSITIKRGLLFSGGQSVGKNVLVENMAQILNLPYTLITVGEDTTTSDLIGSKSTKESQANKITLDAVKAALKGDEEALAYLELSKLQSSTVQIEMVLSAIAETLETGGVICINEINLALANLISKFLNQILDGTGFFEINGYGRVKVHPMAVITATQNPDAVGTQKQNTPTMTRFDTLDFGYPETVTEILKAGVAGELRKRYEEYLPVNPRLAERFNKSVDDVEPTIWKQCNKLHMECVRANRDGVIGEAAVNIRGMIAAIVAYLIADDNIKDRIQVSIGNNACLGKDEKATYHQKLDERF